MQEELKNNRQGNNDSTEKIGDRLTKGFLKVALMGSVAALIGCIAIFFISSQYSAALTNYGFAQGDIGKAMAVFTETRSSLRGAIGYDHDEDIETVMESYEVKKEAFDTYMVDVKAGCSSDEELAAYEEILKSSESYFALADEIIKEGSTTDTAAFMKAQDRELEELTPLFDETYQEMLALMNVNIDRGNELETSLNVLKIVLMLVVLAIVVIAFSISIKTGKTISDGISRPLGRLAKRLREFAEGDINSEFPVVEKNDEIGQMVREADGMAENLRMLIEDLNYLLNEMANSNFDVRTGVEKRYVGDFEPLLAGIRAMNRQMTETLLEINGASEQVSAGSGNMADGAQALAEGATEQAGAIEELQATFVTITEAVEKTSAKADDSYQQAKQYALVADRSRDEMQIMTKAMERISETSLKINDIVSEIESIASQTNLLSLNASIEAARAGDAGRGFAVVAEEIRQLAEQSAQSAVNARELVESSLHEVSEGNKAAEHVAASIQDVVAGINEIADASKQLNEITGEQANAMEQAEQGLTQITEIVQVNSATAEESSATSEELSAQAVAMNELVSKFKLRRD